MNLIKRWLPIIIVFFSTSGAGIFSYMLYADVYLTHEVLDGREVAGEVSDIKNSVNRKLSDRFVFNSVQKEDRVYWNDTIQTTAGAKVSISMSDGTKISLGESALVVLEKESGGLSLKLKSGNLVIEGESANTAVSVNGIKVEKDANKSITLNVDGKSGVMTKASEDGVAEQIDLAKIKKAEEEKRLEEERKKIEEEKRKEEIERNRKMLAPELLAPKAGAKVDFSKQNTWSWSPVEGAVEYRLLVRTVSRTKSKLVYEKNFKSTKAQVDADLDDGNYSWSVFAIDRFGTESPALESKIEVFHSEALDAPELDTSEVQ